MSIIMDHLGAAVAAKAIDGRPSAKAITDVDRHLRKFAANFDAAAALALVEQVKIAQGQIDIQLSRSAIAEALGVKSEMIAPAFLPTSRTFQMRRRGVETRLLLGDDPAMLDPALLKFVARAHVWWEQMRSGSTLGELAEQEGVTKRVISFHLPAAFLAPDILELIVDGRQPPSLTAQVLRTQAIPALWDDQRTMFGIPNPIAKTAKTIPARARLFPADVEKIPSSAT